MNTILGVIIGFLILMLLVVIHELGHFVAARKNGVVVEEFGIGFPPRFRAWIKDEHFKEKLAEWKKQRAAGENVAKPRKWHKLPKSEWGKKQKSLIFSLNYLPIGGFCSMKGESDSDKRPHSFGSASFWQKTKILFAGVTMNWLAAFIILTGLAWAGMPNFMENQFYMPGDSIANEIFVTVKDVSENSPADKAGFLSGDKILKINEESIDTTADVFINNDINAGQLTNYLIERNGEQIEIQAQLNPRDAEDYLLGVTLSQSDIPTTRATWSAPIVAAVNTVQMTGETYRGLWTMLKSLGSGIGKQFSSNSEVRAEGKYELKTVGDSVSGPVGIVGILFPASFSAGPKTIAMLAAIISVSLACMNVLPIPALDGGRFLLIALFRMRGKQLTKETEEKIVSRTFIFLLLLITIVTVLDIMRLI